MRQSSAVTPPFDSVLVVSFGGPQGPDDIRPFLANVLRGRRIPPERVEEVAKHYEDFGGVSPLTAITKRQVEGLKTRLAALGIDVPVYLGMRNWHPYLVDTLRHMHQAGHRRAIGFISALLGTELPGHGSIFLSASIVFKTPVRIGDTVVTTGAFKLRSGMPVVIDNKLALDPKLAARWVWRSSADWWFPSS